MTSPQTRSPSPRARLIVSVIIWLLCSPGLLLHLMYAGFAFSALFAGETYSPFNAGNVMVGVVGPLTVFPWFALLYMNYLWIADMPAHWGWPLAGTTIALTVMIPLAFFPALVCAPGVLFATYLGIWHLRRARRKVAPRPLESA